MNMNRAAFQILFANARYPSVRLSEKAMSVPGAAIAASVNRVASVPNRSMISSGSITLPLVFDIFCRSASRTSAWIYTCRKGTLSSFLSARRSPS